jgi:ABC-type branched-subunit amino acid transport system substrate-binding protein
VYSLSAGSFAWLGEQFPEAVQRTAIVTGSLPTTRTVAARYSEAVESLGWNIVHRAEYNPLGEPTWRPFVEAMAQDGVEAIIWVGEPENLAKLKQAMAEVDYEPTFIRADANHYDPRFIELAGSAATDVYVHVNFYPFDEESAQENDATRQYLEIMEQFNPSGKVAYLGLQGFSAFLLFATAANECGSDLTRACVYDEAKAVSDWTGGGLHARQHPDTGAASECFALVKATPDGFVLADIDPNEDIYRCDPDNVITLTGDYGQGTKLSG